MPLISAIAGQYTGSLFVPEHTQSTYPIGLLSEEGFELSWVTHAKRVNRTSGYGNTLIEGIYLGSDWRIRFRCLEFGKAGPTVAAWPWQQTQNNFQTSLPNIGARYTDNALGLSLTAVTGTPAYAQGQILTFTANTVIASDNNQIGFSFTSKLRSLPVELLILPSTNMGDESEAQPGTTTWFTTT